MAILKSKSFYSGLGLVCLAIYQATEKNYEQAATTLFAGLSVWFVRHAISKVPPAAAAALALFMFLSPALACDCQCGKDCKCSPRCTCIQPQTECQCGRTCPCGTCVCPKIKLCCQCDCEPDCDCWGCGGTCRCVSAHTAFS